MSIEDQKRANQKISKELLEEYEPVSLPRDHQWSVLSKQIVSRLSSANDLSLEDWRIMITSLPTVDSLSVKGVVIIHSGLIIEMKKECPDKTVEDILSILLVHEISHALCNHWIEVQEYPNDADVLEEEADTLSLKYLASANIPVHTLLDLEQMHSKGLVPSKISSPNREQQLKIKILNNFI